MPDARKTTTPLKAIRAHCLECCSDSPKEVRECHLTGCPLWDFRLGTNPHRAGIGGNPKLTGYAPESWLLDDLDIPQPRKGKKSGQE